MSDEHSHLSPVGRELVHLIGYEHASTIMQRWGGGYLDIPKDPARANRLLEALPMSAVIILCAHYHGERIKYIPKLDSINRKMRNEEIRREFGSIGIRHIAKKHNLSIEYIRSIIKGCKQAQQLTLF